MRRRCRNCAIASRKKSSRPVGTMNRDGYDGQNCSRGRCSRRVWGGRGERAKRGWCWRRRIHTIGCPPHLVLGVDLGDAPLVRRDLHAHKLLRGVVQLPALRWGASRPTRTHARARAPPPPPPSGSCQAREGKVAALRFGGQAHLSVRKGVVVAGIVRVVTERVQACQFGCRRCYHGRARWRPTVCARAGVSAQLLACRSARRPRTQTREGGEGLGDAEHVGAALGAHADDLERLLNEQQVALGHAVNGLDALVRELAMWRRCALARVLAPRVRSLHLAALGGTSTSPARAASARTCAMWLSSVWNKNSFGKKMRTPGRAGRAWPHTVSVTFAICRRRISASASIVCRRYAGPSLCSSLSAAVCFSQRCCALLSALLCASLSAAARFSQRCCALLTALLCASHSSTRRSFSTAFLFAQLSLFF